MEQLELNKLYQLRGELIMEPQEVNWDRSQVNAFNLVFYYTGSPKNMVKFQHNGLLQRHYIRNDAVLHHVIQNGELIAGRTPYELRIGDSRYIYPQLTGVFTTTVDIAPSKVGVRGPFYVDFYFPVDVPMVMYEQTFIYQVLCEPGTKIPIHIESYGDFYGREA